MNNQNYLTYLRGLHNEQMDKFLYTLLIFKDTGSSSEDEDIVARKLKQQLIEDFISIPIELKSTKFLVWCLSKRFFLIDHIDASLFTADLKKKIILIQPEAIYDNERLSTDPELYQTYNDCLKKKYVMTNFYRAILLGFMFAVISSGASMTFGNRNEIEYQRIASVAIVGFLAISIFGIIGRYLYSLKKKKELWQGL